MPMTTSDILRNADAFRRAHPNWPHAGPPADEPSPETVLRERTARIRAILAGQSVPPLPGAPRIEVLVPGDDPETERLYAEEKADHD